MENKIEVKSLTIKIGKKEIVLTPAEAKELKKGLSDFFETKDNNYYYWPYYPYRKTLGLDNEVWINTWPPSYTTCSTEIAQK